MFLNFTITLGILIGLLYLSACIPKEAIRDNLLESVEYLEENEKEFYFIEEGNRRTVIDNYADTILYNIMYSIDDENRMRTLLISPFYSGDVNSEYQMISILKERIAEEKTIDTVYDRYWHGMQIIMRPMFTFWNIRQIRWIMIGTLSFLLGILAVCLWKRKQKAMSVSMIVSALLVSYPMIGMCMEYVSTFFIMLVISLICLRNYQEQLMVIHLMLISGICCGFFDFLTTETVAIVIPMAIVLSLRQQDGILKSLTQELKFVIGCGIVWGTGYLTTMATKWVLSGCVLKSNRIGEAIFMMGYRQGGDVLIMTENSMSQPLEALAENIRLLVGFPLTIKTKYVLIITAMILGAVFCFVYVYRKTGKTCVLPALLALLSCVPVIRIIILNSHSYEHSFFTYRALFATICCILTAVVKITDVNLLKK